MKIIWNEKGYWIQGQWDKLWNFSDIDNNPIFFNADKILSTYIKFSKDGLDTATNYAVHQLFAIREFGVARLLEENKKKFNEEMRKKKEEERKRKEEEKQRKREEEIMTPMLFPWTLEAKKSRNNVEKPSLKQILEKFLAMYDLMLEKWKNPVEAYFAAYWEHQNNRDWDRRGGIKMKRFEAIFGWFQKWIEEKWTSIEDLDLAALARTILEKFLKFSDELDTLFSENWIKIELIDQYEPVLLNDWKKHGINDQGSCYYSYEGEKWDCTVKNLPLIYASEKDSKLITFLEIWSSGKDDPQWPILEKRIRELADGYDGDLNELLIKKTMEIESNYNLPDSVKTLPDGERI